MYKFCKLIILLLFVTKVQSQSVGINNTGATANSSSIIDISSTTKGMLIPRLTKVQKNAIVTPATGLLVYQSSPDSIGFHYYNGAIWVWLLGSDVTNTFAWRLQGNTATNPSQNFIGTSDAQPLRFRIYNRWSGTIDSLARSTSFGFKAGASNGPANVAIGNQSLNNNTSGFNVAIGDSAMAIAGGASNTVAIGNKALRYLGSPSFATAVGSEAMMNYQTGGNTAVGYQALKGKLPNVTGGFNTALGFRALATNDVGSQNVAIGHNTMQNAETADYNVAIGYQAENNLVSGDDNVSIGRLAHEKNKIGFSNTSIGSNTLTLDTAGFNNVAIGNFALSKHQFSKNNIAIGNIALENAGNTVTVADRGINNIGIGSGALRLNAKGNNNVGIGHGSMNQTNDSAVDNTAIGTQSLFKGGLRNAAVGAYALYNNIGSGNVALGYEAAFGTSTGNNNVAIGNAAMRQNLTQGKTIAIGDSALYNLNTGNENTAIGSKSLFSNTTGNRNVAVGFNALLNSSTGSNNVAIGDSTARSNTTGSSNISIGNYANFKSTTASKNIAIGSSALQENTLNASNIIAIGDSASYFNQQSGGIFIGNGAGRNRQNYSEGFRAIVIGELAGDSSVANWSTIIGNEAGKNNKTWGNTFIGSAAGEKNTFGANTFIGDNAGRSNTTGSSNTYLGYFAGYNGNGSRNVNIGHNAGYTGLGSDNIFLGHEAGYVNGNNHNNIILIGAGTLTFSLSGNPLNNAIAIGSKSRVRLDNAMVLGSINGVNGATANTNVGIGVDDPSKSVFTVSANSSTNGVTNGIFGFNQNGISIQQNWSTIGFNQYRDNTAANVAKYMGNGFAWVNPMDPVSGNMYWNSMPSGTANTITGAETNRVTFTPTGRVGIGTTAPNSTLHIAGNMSVGTAFPAGGTIGSPTSLEFMPSYTSLSNNGASSYYQLPNAVNYPGRIYYLRNISSAAGANVILVSAGGSLCEGGSAGCFTNYVMFPNASSKTVIAISDGANWTVGTIN